MKKLKFLRDKYNMKPREMILAEAYRDREVIELTREIAKERHPDGFNLNQLRACSPEAIQLLEIKIVEQENMK